MYSYRSPLALDPYYSEEYPNHHAYGPRAPRPPGPMRFSPPFQRPQRPPPAPYSRPRPSSSQGPKYSSRYQDTSYPKELNDMFGALECKLCAVEVTSPITAKMHYSGKPHAKKVKSFLEEWSEKTGKPMPKVEQNIPQNTASTLAEYCELCDVRLLTTNDKMMHYSGKAHRKNEADPANAKKRGKTYETIDLSTAGTRFGIGLGFTSEESKKLAEVSEDKKISDFVCEICDVKAVSQEQLSMHLSGKKHLEKVKKKEGGVPKPERRFKCKICKVSLDTLKLLQMHLDGKPHAKVLKKLDEEYKGKSCKICNVMFTSYSDYDQHINGQKHEKKEREYALKNPIKCPDQKEALTCKSCPYVGNMDDHICDKSFENIMIKEESTWKCVPCYNTTFETEEEYEEHKKTRRHLLCMLNVEGDKISEDKIHWYCFTCRNQYHSMKDFCGHLFEHKHMTLSDEKCDLGSKTDLWHCKVCSVIMDQQTKNEHMRSKRHLLMAARLDITRTLTALATEELGTHRFHCTHCDCNFNNFVAYSDHMLASEHLEQIVEAKMREDMEVM